MSNVFERSVAFSLTIAKVGVKKKVDTRKMQMREEYGAQPDQAAIGVNKEIITCPEYDAIGKLDGQTRTALGKLALPSPLRSGIYLIPLDLVSRVDEAIEQYKQQRRQMVDVFCNAYSRAVRDAEQRLGGLFDGNDYPDVDSVRAAFQVATAYLDLGLPKTLEQQNADIYTREQQAFKERLNTASDEIRAALRESFQELISHMADRLQPGTDGKPRIFRDSLVLNLREFLDSFQARNITDDAELDKLVSQARQVLNGKSAQALRDFADTRDQVKTGLTAIKEQLSTMVTTAPVRKFSFDE